MMGGFIPGSRASLAIDTIITVTIAILPIFTFSLYMVRIRRNYALHKKIQIFLGLLLLVALSLFEVEIRIFGWRQYAEPSPYYSTWVFPVLFIHLLFALTTTVLWSTTTIQAIRHFGIPPRPGPYSKEHLRLARAATISMYGTGITSAIFYWIAFLAT